VCAACRNDEWKRLAVTWRTPCQLDNTPRTQLILLVHELGIRQLSPAGLPILLFIGVLGCSGDPGNAALAHTASRPPSSESIELPSATYRAVALGAIGSIAGLVEIDGNAPADSIVTPSVDRELCGSAYPDSSAVLHGRALANVVVWLSDVREGKTLPVERRTEIVNEECRLEPRVQGVVVGTTVNVLNEDRLAHTMRFLHGGPNGDTLAVIPLTDDGQVVPNEHLTAKAGLVAAACVQHPWTRGYIVVFESPYYAVTGASGAFRIDSVPPGKYRLLVWHEREEARVEREVDVTAGGTARVDLKLRLR
jgi:hypothetical protein